MKKSDKMQHSNKIIYGEIALLVLVLLGFLVYNNSSQQPAPAPELLNKEFQNCYPTQTTLNTDIILLPLDAPQPNGYTCIKAPGPRTVITTTRPKAQSTTTQLKDIAEIEAISGTTLKLQLVRSTISNYPGAIYSLWSLISGRMMKITNVYSNGYMEKVYLKKGKSGLVGEASLIVPASRRLNLTKSESKVNFEGLARPTGQVNVILARKVLEDFGFALSGYDYYFFYVELQSKGYDTAQLGLPNPSDLNTLGKFARNPKSVDPIELLNAAERVRNVRLRTKIEAGDLSVPGQ